MSGRRTPDLKPPRKGPAVAGSDSTASRARIPGPCRNSAAWVLLGTIRPLLDVDFFFSLLSKVFYQWTFWLCFWNPHGCIFYTTILPFSPNLIFLSIMYLKVRLKCVLYEFPTFTIQAIVPLHSKSCDMGGNANISHSSITPNSTPLEKKTGLTT